MSVPCRVQVPVVHTVHTDESGHRCAPDCPGYVRGLRPGRALCREFLQRNGDRTPLYDDVRLVACLAAEALQRESPRPFRPRATV